MTDTPVWTPSATTSGFSAPSATPPAPGTGHHEPESSSTTVKNGPRRRDPVMIVLSVLLVVLLAGAGVLTWKALQPQDLSAPTPADEFERPADGAFVGPDGQDAVDLDDGSQMTVADMAPNSLFIPAIGAYLPIESSDTFVSSHYAGFNTLKVPKDPRHGVRYSAGAPMYAGEAGTTMIAAHVSARTGWGALRYLYTLSGGEVIYTKDEAGQLQSWQVTTMRVEKHTDFPQEYWSAEGIRQLVVTTCGGTLHDGQYDKNIFAIATPIEPRPALEDYQGDADQNVPSGQAPEV